MTVADPILTRVALERLVDQLDNLGRLVEGDGELDRRDLEDRVSSAMLLATATLDSLN